MTLSIVSEARLKNLTNMLREAPEGAVVEVGVYRGGSLYEMVTRYPGRTYHAFDTFSGLPEKTEGVDLHRVGDFGDSNYEDVKWLFSDKLNVVLHRGFFPKDFPDFNPGPLALIHIDVDMFESTRACLMFAHQHLVSGGIIVCDDYSAPTTPGAKFAVHRFLAQFPGDYEILHIVECQITMRKK